MKKERELLELSLSALLIAPGLVGYNRLAEDIRLHLTEEDRLEKLKAERRKILTKSNFTGENQLRITEIDEEIGRDDFHGFAGKDAQTVRIILDALRLLSKSPSNDKAESPSSAGEEFIGYANASEIDMHSQSEFSIRIDALTDQVQKLDAALRKIGAHVGATCGGVDTDQDDPLHTANSIIDRFNCLKNDNYDLNVALGSPGYENKDWSNENDRISSAKAKKSSDDIMLRMAKRKSEIKEMERKANCYDALKNRIESGQRMRYHDCLGVVSSASVSFPANATLIMDE